MLQNLLDGFFILIELVNTDGIIPAVYFKGRPGFDIKSFVKNMRKNGYIMPVFKVPFNDPDDDYKESSLKIPLPGKWPGRFSKSCCKANEM